MPKQRLQKILAAAGVDSRRNCEELILDGVVRVNRKVVDTLPAFADPDTDTITVNNKRIRAAEKVYFLLNKPKGVICTNADPRGRRKAIDLVSTKQRIFCVGRLDADTSGLILLTNDSELTNKLTHPKYELQKSYVAGVKGMATGEQIELRRAIPHRWWAPGSSRDETIRQVQRMVPGTTEEHLVAGALDRLRDELVSTRQPLIPGQLEQLRRVDEIDNLTVVAPRDPMLWSLRHETDEVILSCFGNEIAFPAAIEDALSALLTAGSTGLAVGDVAGSLDDEEKLVLVRRLIREGVLEARWS